METYDIMSGLRSLSESLRRFKTLLAWAELERSERRRGEPPSFRIESHVADDLRNEYGFFIKTAMDIRDVLGEIPKAKREALRRRLVRLEGQIHRLNLPQGL